MNDGDVSRQIQQMVRFIRQEAEEKANEISVSAEEVRPLSVSLPISSDLLISLDFNRDSISVYNGRIADFVSDQCRSGYFEYLCRNSTSRSCS